MIKNKCPLCKSKNILETTKNDVTFHFETPKGKDNIIIGIDIKCSFCAECHKFYKIIGVT